MALLPFSLYVMAHVFAACRFDAILFAATPNTPPLRCRFSPAITPYDMLALYCRHAATSLHAALIFARAPLCVERAAMPMIR